MITTFTVRCKHCNRVLAELSGVDYVIKCGRCDKWNTRHGVADSRPAVLALKISLDDPLQLVASLRTIGR